MAFNVATAKPVETAVKPFPTKQTYLKSKSLRVKLITATKVAEFEQAINEFGLTQNVKATQTHVTFVKGVANEYFQYTAVVFYD